jgi:4-diphosphocytidyl-2-C-methyl-D-erythritol kinase
VSARGRWLRATAAAKVTLSLRVLRAREDGYHEIEAFTVGASAPHDVVLVDRTRRRRIDVRVEPSGAAPTGRANLAVRAAEALWPSIPLGGGLRITLRKHIPVGAGLGGGSSDAAAVLRALAPLAAMTPERVLEIAGWIGSDVPFCVRGEPAWVRGRGEVLEGVGEVGATMLVIAAPPFGCSTPVVYRAWDDLGGPSAARSLDAPPALRHVVGELVNDLEPAAEHVEPRLVPFRHRLEELLGRPALLCGSGSAYTAWFDDEVEWRAAVDRAQVGLGPQQVWSAIAR